MLVRRKVRDQPCLGCHVICDGGINGFYAFVRQGNHHTAFVVRVADAAHQPVFFKQINPVGHGA